MNLSISRTPFITIICLNIIISFNTYALVEYDQNVTNNTIFGSGNANGSFTTDRRNGIEVGLRAKIPDSGTIYSNGDGTYSYSLMQTEHPNCSIDPRAPQLSHRALCHNDGPSAPPRAYQTNNADVPFLPQFLRSYHHVLNQSTGGVRIHLTNLRCAHC